MDKSTIIGKPNEIKTAREIGLSGLHKMLYLACIDCQKLRWVPLYRHSQRCPTCTNKRIRGPRPWQSERQRGDKNPAWRGGKVKGGNGYIYELVPPDSWLRPMANKTGYAMQHRLVMATHLGRLLHQREQVHHLNGIRTDNRIENLELWKLSQPAGVRQADYHCPGCQCKEKLP